MFIGMNNKELSVKAVFWALWTALTAVCVYYIIHNAQWLIGDDAILIRHTGWGKAFLASDTINPQAGRFFPFAYLVYDVLLSFGGDHISPAAHFVLHAVFFVVFVVSVTILILDTLEGLKLVWKYTIALLAVVVFVGRVYPQFTECFSTAWFSYTIIAAFMLCVFMFYKKQKWVYGIIALLCLNYYCYCGESAFVLPLSFGACALMFQHKTMTTKEKVFNWCLVGSALLFLILYAIKVLPYIETAYDGSHGEEVNIWSNMVNMLWAQKLLLLALVLFVVRLVDILRNKKEYTIYDNLLMTAAACCCANFVLRLNWTLYYNISALLVIPPLLHFSIEYLNERWTLALFVLLALFYGRKIPATIQKNQDHRENVSKEMSSLMKNINEVDAVFWYAPDADVYSYGLELREWRYDCLCAYLGWMYHDKDYSITKVKEFHNDNNTLWLTTSDNEAMFPDDTQLMDSGDKVFDADFIQGYLIGPDK